MGLSGERLGAARKMSTFGEGAWVVDVARGASRLQKQHRVNETRHFAAKATCPLVMRFIAGRIADERVSPTGVVRVEFAAWLEAPG
jgi:hypothetical protein